MVVSPQVCCLLIFFRRPLATRTAAGSTTKKCDEFPSPHDVARAEDYIGYAKNITFWIENCAVRDTQAGRSRCLLWVRSGDERIRIAATQNDHRAPFRRPQKLCCNWNAKVASLDRRACRALPAGPCPVPA